MKRYKMIYVEDIIEHEDGKWVPAEVAQALYDAVQMQTSILCSLRKNYEEDSGLWSDVDEWIKKGNDALSLADGGE